MWKPVTIKPNDQSLVGETINRFGRPEEKIKILHVGEWSFFGCACLEGKRSEATFLLDSDWLIWEEEKPKKLMAPALIKSGVYYRLTETFYDSEQAAINDCGSYFKLISWPAKPNADGYYEVPE